MLSDGCSTFARFLLDVGLPIVAMIIAIVILTLAALGIASLMDGRR